MYEIRPDSIKTFISDRSIRLPRFQRKQTWDAKKNFQLCISLFKQYPIGVCILSVEKYKERTAKFLLDGRQRRNALKQLAEDPENLYLWAKKFLDLKASDQPYEVKEKYYSKINAFLEEDEDEVVESQVKQGEDVTAPVEDAEEYGFDWEDDEDVSDEEGTTTESDIDEASGKDQLLRIILAIHKKDKRSSGFTRPFDFSKCVEKLPYVRKEGKTYSLNSRDLKEFINAYRSYCEVKYDDDYAQEEHLFNFIQSRHTVTKEKELKKLIHINWDDILEKIQILQIIDDVLSDSKIGVIEVKDMKSSDYQKIFSLINSQGAPLKAIEILSSKPKWNIIIKHPSSEAQTAVSALYKEIGIVPENVVRWDLPATFLKRIDENSILSNKIEFVKGLTIAFKILSGIYTKGVTKENIEKLADTEDINWEVDIDNLVRDINTMFVLMKGCEYFKYLSTWRTNLMDLTSDFIAMNFFILCYLNWCEKGKPIGSGAEVRKFQKECFILWDKLIYEYVKGAWKSSADSKIRINIEKLSDNFVPVSKEDWTALLNEVFDHSRINGDDITFVLMKPLLYHYYCLAGIEGPSAVKFKALDVDHIIPQTLFETSMYDRASVIKDNLLNLGILPKESNTSKGGKKLVQISDNKVLVEEIKKYEFIDEADFKKYSDITNYQEMFDMRRKHFELAYKDLRTKLLHN